MLGQLPQKTSRSSNGRVQVIYITVVFPLVVGIAFPLIVQYALHIGSGHGITALTLPRYMDAFSVWFLIGAAIIPTTIASYSLVGEKIQKSLEPLLATPMTDGEILLGKTISGLVVPLGGDLCWFSDIHVAHGFGDA